MDDLVSVLLCEMEGPTLSIYGAQSEAHAASSTGECPSTLLYLEVGFSPSVIGVLGIKWLKTISVSSLIPF